MVNEGLISYGGERKKPPSHSVAAANCPLWVRSGQAYVRHGRPLYPCKRTYYEVKVRVG